MNDLSPALLEELAKGFNPDAWDESKALPADVRAKLQYWAREAVSDLAPILSRALAEAKHEGAEKMRDGILNQIRSIPCWNNGQTSEFDIEDQSHRLTVLDDIKWVPNPYLTEKEHDHE